MKKTRKKMILSASVLTALALFAGCTSANAASPDPTAARIAETAPAAQTITLEEAKAIAYAHAGVSESDARDKSYERDDGIYEIDFEHSGFEYDYDISRQGEILKAEKEPERTAKPAESKPAETAPTSKTITLEEAKAIAYAHAGVSESDALDKSYERDDGIYEIDFEHGGYEYDYDISRQGEILKVEKEPERTAKPAENKPAETKPAAQTITLEEAKAIAYAHAGVSESDARDKSYERDDGIFEIDFEHGGFEYDYDISRQGEILKVEKEPERSAKSAGSKPAESKPAETKPAQTKSDRISAEKALSIALDHAGVTDARDRDVEWDDGRWEVSFESGRTEYEYDISADGTILHWEKEIDD